MDILDLIQHTIDTIVFLPLFKSHEIYNYSAGEGWDNFNTIFVADKNGKKTTFDAHEHFGANSIIFRNKKNIFFTTTAPYNNYGDNYFFSIYSYNNGVITKVYNDEDFFEEPEATFFDKTNFSKTNRIQCTYKDDEGEEYMIEYEYSEENNTWKKIEDIMASDATMKRYIENLVDSKEPIKITGRSLNPENCKGKNHYSSYYKNYYNGVCYSSVYMTQRREINSLPINYKGFIYPIKLTDDNILIGTSSTEEHYYMEDYDEDELIFIDFKNAYNNKEIILPPYKLSTIKIGRLEVMTEDLGLMEWKEAKKACENLGDGWRLPTKYELNLLYENKDKIGGFAISKYWSSTEEDNDTAWYQSFTSGGQYANDKNLEFFVRAVRGF